jgi:hypothetical protein
VRREIRAEGWEIRVKLTRASRERKMLMNFLHGIKEATETWAGPVVAR